MKTVYVTESGVFDQRGFFNDSSVIGVDFDKKEAVSYPIRRGCYRYNVRSGSSGFIIVYKSPYSSYGYRVSRIYAY